MWSISFVLQPSLSTHNSKRREPGWQLDRCSYMLFSGSEDMVFCSTHGISVTLQKMDCLASVFIARAERFYAKLRYIEFFCLFLHPVRSYSWLNFRSISYWFFAVVLLSNNSIKNEMLYYNWLSSHWIWLLLSTSKLKGTGTLHIKVDCNFSKNCHSHLHGKQNTEVCNVSLPHQWTFYRYRQLMFPTIVTPK